MTTWIFAVFKKNQDICRQCLFVHKKNGLYLRNSCAVDSPIRFEEQNNVVTNKNKISGAIFCLQQLKCPTKKTHNHCHPWNLILLIFLLLRLRSPYESVYKHIEIKKNGKWMKERRPAWVTHIYTYIAYTLKLKDILLTFLHVYVENTIKVIGKTHLRRKWLKNQQRTGETKGNPYSTLPKPKVDYYYFCITLIYITYM